jgi:hypothetical protein
MLRDFEEEQGRRRALAVKDKSEEKFEDEFEDEFAKEIAAEPDLSRQITLGMQKCWRERERERGGGLSPDQARWISCRPGYFL